MGEAQRCTIQLDITFANQAQRAFYYATERNQCFSSGFNSGKTYSGCLKAFTLLSTFPNYRMSISRQVYADLKRTTMQTFFKICPRELIDRHNEQDGFTSLKNNSAIFWLHLDKVDEGTLRGLEINSNLTDQAEETEEKVYDVLDGRIARWDFAEVPSYLLEQSSGWPLNKNGKPVVPSYNMLLCNPDTQFHYIYRKYHPDSLERRKNYFYVECEWDPTLGSYETYQEALKHDDEWVNKYVRGQWGLSNAQIHRVPSECILEPNEALLERIKTKGNLFRVLDHGDASPTSCLWFAVLDGVYIAYREYYVPGKVISYHRRAISELSGGESYTGNYADPQIFKKTSQKDGGFWTTADEYMDRSIDAPPLYWIPADNNEFATRNRINELLVKNDKYKNPLTGEPGGFGLYFIKRTQAYASGCQHAITETQSQRRKLIGYVDGKAIYCDDREESVVDHAYDCVRYFVAMHGLGRHTPERKAPERSLKWYKMMRDRGKNQLVAASA